ncbi:MAG: hypothetical protein IK099_02875 [Clostridia bacterium]|nr:hypothetical protein [Clostridia bacterium]
MFGRRADGRVLKNIDPIIALTPYLMPMRCDAQVMSNYKLDYEKMARYIVEQGNKGHKLTFMEIIIAAYVRTVSQLPEINRFVVNKRLYARTQLTVSFALLKDTGDPNKIEENTVKCYFDPHDTIYDVAERINAAIAQNRKEEADNSTMKVAKLLLNPILANIVVAFARLTDRYGILPKYILDASPFHTSMFFTQMASIGMPAVNHHIYNFGTTSLFVSMGSIQRETVIGPDGKAVRKRWLPVGFTADERICAGAEWAKLVDRVMYYIGHLEELETPPEAVLFEEGNEYSVPKYILRQQEKQQKKSIAG